MSSSLASTFSRLFSNDTPTSAIDFLSNWNDLDRKSNFNRYGSQLTTMAIGFGEEDNYQLSHYAKGISEFQSRDTNLDDNQLKSLLTTMALGEEENDKINRCNTEAIGGENYNSILPGGCYPSSIGHPTPVTMSIRAGEEDDGYNLPSPPRRPRDEFENALKEMMQEVMQGIMQQFLGQLPNNFIFNMFDDSFNQSRKVVRPKIIKQNNAEIAALKMVARRQKEAQDAMLEELKIIGQLITPMIKKKK